MFGDRLGWLTALGAVVPAVCMSCSDGASPQTRGDDGLESQAAALTAAASAAPRAGASDAYAVALPASPSARCTVHPQGVTADASRSSVVSASVDGKLRFYPPSQDWGTKLTVECSADGEAQAARTIDLADASTFERLAPADVAPRVVGKRPALTGDLSALSQQALQAGGYPARPDPVEHPAQYELWLRAVTKPFDTIEAITTASLTDKFTGVDEGGGTAAWSAMVQSANGFVDWNGGKIAALGSTYYTGYWVGMAVPQGICSSGKCFTGIWGGVGGYPEQVPFIGGEGFPSLIQSGFGIRATGVAQPFIDYAPNTAIFLGTPAGRYNAGDQFLVSGTAATGSDCKTPSTTGPWACFNFWDTTNNWMYASPIPVPPPANSSFLAATVEYAVELGSTNPPSQNAFYFVPQNGTIVPATMTGLGFDQNGNIHGDPGSASGTDPYVATVQVDPSGTPYNQCNWSNGGVNVPVDPVTFTFQSAN